MVLVSVAMLIVVSDCKKDDTSGSGSSKFTVGSTSYPLSKGYIEDNTSYVTIGIISSGLTVSGNNMTGSGNVVMFDIHPATAGSYAGTYTYNSAGGDNKYDLCAWELNFRPSGDTYIADYAGVTVTGTITITKSGSNYVITVPSTSAYSEAYGSDTPTSTTFSLSYSGTLTATSSMQTIGKMVKAFK